MRAADLVRDLRARGVDLWAADGSSLRYRGPKEVLEPALADLKARKPDVLRLLTQLVATQEAAELCLDWLRSVPQVALDIETYATPEKYRGLYTLGRPRLLSFAHGTTVRSVDIDAVDLGIVKQMLEAIVEKTKFLHHATFDLPRLYRLTGILLTDNIHDTMIASKTARAGEWTDWGKPKEHSLDDVIERELGVKIPKDRKMKWSADLTEAHLEYAADDVIYLENLHEALRKVLVDHSVLDRYEAVRATLPTFLRAAVRGVPVDTRRLEELIAASAAEEDRLLAEVRTFEPDHPDDAQWVWKNKNKKDKVDRWGNRIGRNGALRALSLLGVDLPNLETDSTLVDHREDHLLVPVLRDYYKAADEHSHYQKWPAQFIEGGRIFPQPKVAGTVTGRVLYSEPNILGIEKRKTKKYREVIKAPPGRSIVTGDFAQQELRIAAYFSKDENMLDAFSQGDFYTKTAEKMVGHPVDRKGPERAAAKRATLGFLYGLGIEKYRQNVFKDTGLKLSKTEADRDRELFRETFAGFRSWQEDYGKDGAWTTRSALGWRRHVGPQKDEKTDQLIPKYTDRLNGPIQSTAADILYLTLTKMDDDAWCDGKAQFLIAVYDEIVLECSEDAAADVARWLHQKMREAFEEVLGSELGGPESVEVSYGPSWGEQVELPDPDQKA